MKISLLFKPFEQMLPFAPRVSRFGSFRRGWYVEGWDDWFECPNESNRSNSVTIVRDSTSWRFPGAQLSRWRSRAGFTIQPESTSRESRWFEGFFQDFTIHRGCKWRYWFRYIRPFRFLITDRSSEFQIDVTFDNTNCMTWFGFQNTNFVNFVVVIYGNDITSR